MTSIELRDIVKLLYKWIIKHMYIKYVEDVRLIYGIRQKDIAPI